MRGRHEAAPAFVVLGVVLLTGCGGNPVSFEPINGTAGDLTAATATAGATSLTAPTETATEGSLSQRPAVISVTGDVRLEGAVNWAGTVPARCEGHGTDARTVTVEIPGNGRLSISAVPPGVTTVTLTQEKNTYRFSRLGSGGPVRVTAGRTLVTSAVLVQGSDEVIVVANVAC